MDKILVVFIDCLMSALILFYINSHFFEKKTNYKSKRFIFYLLIQATYMTFSYLCINNFIRVLLTFIMISFLCIKFYKENSMKVFIASFIALIIAFFSEILYVITVVILFNVNVDSLKNFYFADLLSNACIVLIMYLISNLRVVKIVYNKIITSFLVTNSKKFIYILLISLTTLAILLYYIYFELEFIYALILGLILIIVFSFLTLSFFSEKFQHEKLKNEYEITLESLSEYEKLYSYQRMMTHEFKNDLLVIRGLTNKRNKKLLNYIDELSNIKDNKTSKLMIELKKIPEGGLRGLLYYKILSMEEEKVNIEFQIENTFKIKDYKSITDNIKSKICKILGIYLDNAIQAVKEIDEKHISIRILEDENFLIFEIINNYCGNVDMSKIYDKGYSTKECGRGYGLTIAKEAIVSDITISNETHIIGNKFCQILKIKM